MTTPFCLGTKVPRHSTDNVGLLYVRTLSWISSSAVLQMNSQLLLWSWKVERNSPKYLSKCDDLITYTPTNYHVASLFQEQSQSCQQL